MYVLYKLGLGTKVILSIYVYICMCESCVITYEITGSSSTEVGSLKRSSEQHNMAYVLYELLHVLSIYLFKYIFQIYLTAYSRSFQL